ncbi:MAG: zinc-binding dehydrogenase [Candidatus Omnitrophica bacterium]|nr:zinc-binding dehydrogenase [Candidatus Omnitrophota bacterium]
MIFRTLKVKPGQSVGVFGAGGVGLSAIAAARLAGAKPIVAVDVSRRNLSLARRLGASRAVSALGKKNLPKDLDYAIEASGDPRAMEAAFSSVRDKGGTCVLAGNPAFGRKITIDPFDLIRGKKILGSWGGDARPDEDIPRYASLHLKKRWDLAAFVGAEFPLDRINEAVALFRKGPPGRILIRI